MATDIKDTHTTETSDEDEQAYYNGRLHKRSAFLAGLFAGFIFTAVMLALLWLAITPRSLGNLIADRLSNLLPATFTEFFIQTIGPLGKQIEFFSVLLGQILFGGLLGLLFVWVWPQIKGRSLVARNSFILATVSWLVFMLAVLPLVNAGFFGTTLGDNQVITLVTSFVLFQIFGLAFSSFYQYLIPASFNSVVTVAKKDDQKLEEIKMGDLPNRRRFIIVVSALFMAAAGAAVIGTAFRSSADTARNQLGATALSDGTLEGEVTSNANFYHVSKNAIDPRVDVGNWRLQIDGLVSNPYTFDISQIKTLPPQTQYQTLTCISNPVAGPYISNAKWKGVQLKALIEKANPKPGVKRVVFKAADGYTDSVEYDKALDPATLAAYEMNDVPLPSDHGGPLRMLIPNIYGMKNAKWVTSVTLIDTEDYKGFWEQQGWDNTATIHTESAITSPSDTSSLATAKPVTVRGYAFAGERGIQKVEISTDGGTSWNTAKTKEPLSPNSWVLWSYDWTPAATKSYTLVVRATDKTGAVQTSINADTFPAGSSGWHRITVNAI